MDKEQEAKVQKVREQVDLDSQQIMNVVNEIITPYTQELDNYVDFVKGIITNYDNPPTAQELDDFIMNLSVFFSSCTNLCQADSEHPEETFLY